MNNKHKIIIAILTTIAIGLIITSFFIPPCGVVHSSVLAATGEIFGFSALWVLIKALDDKLNITLKKGDTEINISDDEK